MEYVIFETGGKQYRVNPGDTLDIDCTIATNGLISFDKVLLYVKDGEVAIGKPYLPDMIVTAKVINDFRGSKLRVARFTAKSRHRRVIGFRPSVTRIHIEKISKKTKK